MRPTVMTALGVSAITPTTSVVRHSTRVVITLVVIVVSGLVSVLSVPIVVPITRVAYLLMLRI